MFDSLPLFAGLEPSAAHRTIETVRERRTRLTPVPDDALAALKAATIACEATRATLTLPPIGPDVYEKTKPIIEACGFTWKSRLKTHVGLPGAVAALKQVISAGVYDDTKRALEFFATSASGAEVLARILEAEVYGEPPHILEPSAGDGALVDAILHAIPDARVTAIELDHRRAEKLAAKFEHDPRVRVIRGDFLDFDESGFDGAIQNPPFEFAFEHTQHAAKLVRRGGYVVGIALLTRPKDQRLAEWLNDCDAWDSPVDADTFVDTKIPASFFGFRVVTSYLEQLRETLAPHHSLGERAIRELTVISRDLHVLAEGYCNGDVEGDAYETRFSDLLQRAALLTKPEGIRLVPCSDPRGGHGIRLALPSGITNDWGQTGVIVPPARRSVEVSARRRTSTPGLPLAA
jgi:hypothetical protein